MVSCINMGLDARKPVFKVCKQQRGRPDCAYAQTDHAFVIDFLERIISNLATGEILIL